MKITWGRMFAAAAIGFSCMAGPSAAEAQYGPRSRYEDDRARIAELEAELDDLRSRFDSGTSPRISRTTHDSGPAIGSGLNVGEPLDAYAPPNYDTPRHYDSGLGIGRAPVTTDCGKVFGSCDSCAPCDVCGPAPCGGFYGGFGAVFLKPYFRDNTAYVADPPGVNISVPFDYSYEFSPRAWFGYVNGNGTGIRARYWYLDADASTTYLVPDWFTGQSQIVGGSGFIVGNIFADPGEIFSARHELNLQVADLEATQQLLWLGASVTPGFGVRYARLRQDYSASAIDDTNTLQEWIRHHHSFEGFGPVASLQFVRPFGDSGLGVYGGVRGAVLFGDIDQTVVRGDPDIVETYERSGSELLAVGEIEFGLEYSRWLKYNALAFIRGGWEGQIWWDAGGPTSTTGDMGLQGLNVSFGIRR